MYTLTLESTPQQYDDNNIYELISQNYDKILWTVLITNIMRG